MHIINNTKLAKRRDNEMPQMTVCFLISNFAFDNRFRFIVAYQKLHDGFKGVVR